MKRTLRFLGIIALAAIIGFSAIGCKDTPDTGIDDPVVEYWNITWYLNGGEWASGYTPTTQVEKGAVLSKPTPNPTKEGFNFNDWYTNALLETAYDFSQPVTINRALYAKWDEIPIDGLTEPYLISNSFGTEAATTLLVQWHNDADIETQKLQIVPETGSFAGTVREITADGEEFSSTGENGEYAARNIFKVTVDNLTPNTRYKYRVGNAGAWSDEFYHLTASAAFAPFSFTVASDPQEAVGNPLAPQMDVTLSKAVEFDEDTRFFLLAGDITNEIAKQPAEIVNYTNVANNINIRRPVLATQGNHDTYGVTGQDSYRFNTKGGAGGLAEPGTIFNAFVSFPRNGHLTDETKALSYYFYYNDVLIVMLNSMACDTAAGHAQQVTWLRNLLQEDKDEGKSKYRIIVSHVGPYAGRSQDRYYAGPMRQAYGSIINDFDVSVFFSGHDHIYGRSPPIKTTSAYPSSAVTPVENGTVFSIVSSTGPKFYGVDSGQAGNVRRVHQVLTETDAEQQATVNSTAGCGIFVNVKVTAEKLIVTAMRADGEQIDYYEVMADGSIPVVEQVTVSFNSQGGTSVNPVSVNKGSALGSSFPSNPSRDGFAFQGWFTAATGGTAFTASTQVTADIEVFARWGEPSGTCEFCGGAAPCVAGTSIPVKVGSRVVNVQINTLPDNANAAAGLVYSCANSYTFEKRTAGHRANMAWFTLDLGTKKLSDFEKVRFTYSGTSQGKEIALIARTTAFPNGGVLAHTSGGSTPFVTGGGSNNGYLGISQVTPPGGSTVLSGTVELLINDSAATAFSDYTDEEALDALDASGELYFSFYEHINANIPNRIANIEFVEK